MCLCVCARTYCKYISQEITERKYDIVMLQELFLFRLGLFANTRSFETFARTFVRVRVRLREGERGREREREGEDGSETESVCEYLFALHMFLEDFLFRTQTLVLSLVLVDGRCAGFFFLILKSGSLSLFPTHTRAFVDVL